jgi:RHS repeat-associated protein
VVVDTATDTVSTTIVNNEGSSVALSPDGRQYIETDDYVNIGSGNSYQETVGIYATTAQGGTPADARLYKVSLGTNPTGPNDVVYAPMPLAPSAGTPSPAELAGGANNPSEAGVAGANEVVTTGTPQRLPGVTAGVNTALGSYSFSLDAMSVPDVGVPLDLALTYDSSHASTLGAFGYGWNYSYGMTATQNAYNAAQNPCAVTITQEHGSTISFQPSTTSGFTSGCPGLTYEPEPWVQASLSVVASCNGSDSCWDLTRSDGTQYEIDQTNGELVKEIDLNGNTVTLKYGAVSGVSQCSSNTSTELCEVVGASGVRTLKFTWTSGNVSSVIDGTRTVNLTYSSSDLATISLTPASGSGAVTPEYAFSYSSNLLTSWWDPDMEATNAGNTTYATDVAYGTGSGTCPANASTTVCYVTAPQIADSGTSMTATYTPKSVIGYPSTYPTYPALDPTTGTGTVEVTDPNHTASLAGGDVTLDTYVDHVLVSQVQGYSPSNRTISGTLTSGSQTLTDSGSTFTQADVGRSVQDTSHPTYLPQGTTIISVQSSSQATMSSPSTTTSSGNSVLLGLMSPETISFGDPLNFATYESLEPLGNVTTTSVDAEANTLASTDPMGRTTSSLYNPLNEVTSSTDALGNTTANTYDSHGNELTTTDPIGDVTTNAYNSNGTLCATMNANGHAAGAAGPVCFTPAPTNLSTGLTNGTNYTSLSVSSPMTAASGTTVLIFQGTNEVSTTLSAAASGSTTLSVTSFRANYSYTTSAFVAFVSPYVTEYGYDGQGDQTSVTASDGPSTTVTAAYTTTELYNSIGQQCASLTANGFAAGDTLPTSCPTSGAPFETLNTAFDYYGRVLASISPTNAVGGTTTATYDGNGNELNTASPNGTATSSAYGADNQLCWSQPALVSNPACTHPPTGAGTQTATDFYDADLNEVASVSPDGNAQTTYPDCVYETVTAFDDVGNTLTTTTPTGGTTCANETTTATWSTYDAAGNEITSVSQPPPGQTGNVTTTNAYDAGGKQCWSDVAVVSNPTCSSPPTGSGTQTTTNTYDAGGNQLASVTADGNASGTPYDYATTSAYDAAGRLTTQTLPPPTSSSAGANQGETTTNYYDADGNEVATTEAQGDPGSCNPIMTSGCPYTTYDTYDQQNRTLSTTDPNGDTTSYSFDADGNQLVVTDSSGNTTTTTYDGADNAVSTTTASGGSEDFYDANGNEIAVTGRGGNPATCNPGGAGDGYPSPYNQTGCPYTTYYTYNSSGQVVQTTNPDGNTSTKFYDSSGHRVAVTGAAGNPSTCNPGPQGDGFGAPYNQASCADTAYYTYDNSGQVTQLSYTDGTPTVTYTYGSSGQVQTMTDGTGTTYYTYDSSGRLCRTGTSSGSCSSLTGTILTYGYDSSSNLTCLTYPGASKACASGPSPGTNDVVTYSYNDANQLSTMSDWTGSGYHTLSFAYNANGQECMVSTASSPTCGSPPTQSGAVATTYSYDQAGNTSDIQTSLGNGSGGTSNLLDLNVGSASVANSTTTANSTTVTTTGSFTTVGITTGMSVTGTGIAPGTFVQTVNSATQLTLSAPATGSGTVTLTFPYRSPDGYIVKEVPTVGSTTYPADVYTYNASNQVVSGPITGSGGGNTYSYTSAGGITADTTSFASAGYDKAGVLCWTYSGTSSNSCSSPPSGATSYTTNSDGERTAATPSSGNKEAFGWDTATALLTCANTNGTTCSTSNPTSTTTVYTYTGAALRASSTINSVTTSYTWDTSGGSPLLMSDGNWDYLYVPGAATPIEQVSAAGSSPTSDMLLSDENGNVRGLVQLSTGTHQDQLVNYTDYDAYGNPITESGGSVESGGITVAQTGLNSNWIGTTPWGYGAGYTDPTGLIYLVNRYYDPTTGQFVSVDPLVAQTTEPFEYASDNSVNQGDPTGLSSRGRISGKTLKELGWAAQVAWQLRFLCPANAKGKNPHCLPTYTDGGPLRKAQMAAMLWGLTPVNCHKCGDRPFRLVAGRYGAVDEVSCIDGLLGGGKPTNFGCGSGGMDWTTALWGALAAVGTLLPLLGDSLVFTAAGFALALAGGVNDAIGCGEKLSLRDCVNVPIDVLSFGAGPFDSLVGAGRYWVGAFASGAVQLWLNTTNGKSLQHDEFTGQKIKADVSLPLGRELPQWCTSQGMNLNEAACHKFPETINLDN